MNETSQPLMGQREREMKLFLRSFTYFSKKKKRKLFLKRVCVLFLFFFFFLLWFLSRFSRVKFTVSNHKQFCVETKLTISTFLRGVYLQRC